MPFAVAAAGKCNKNINNVYYKRTSTYYTCSVHVVDVRFLKTAHISFKVFFSFTVMSKN